MSVYWECKTYIEKSTLSTLTPIYLRHESSILDIKKWSSPGNQLLLQEKIEWFKAIN